MPSLSLSGIQPFSSEDRYVEINLFFFLKPVQPAVQLEEDDETEVHFAYSVTVLHHSCVVHCVVPGIPWKKAKTIRPLFNIYGKLTNMLESYHLQQIAVRSK